MKKNIIIGILTFFLCISLVLNIFLFIYNSNSSSNEQPIINRKYIGNWISENYVLDINSDNTFLIYQTENDTSYIKHANSGYIENNIMIYENTYDEYEDYYAKYPYSVDKNGELVSSERYKKELSLSEITLSPLSSVTTKEINLIASNVLEVDGRKYKRTN